MILLITYDFSTLVSALQKISLFELAKITTPNIKPMTINDYDDPPLTMDISLDTKYWKKYL